jgi:hypothetical protein
MIPLTIRDLTPEDLPLCAWWVSARDIAQLGKTLERTGRGEVDYLAVYPPSGLPVALGGVDYTLNPGAGTLWQLSVHGALQSAGIGTLLIKPPSSVYVPAAFTGPSLAWRSATRAPGRCTSG